MKKIYRPVKFANFVYICTINTRCKNNHFRLKKGYFSRAYNANIYKICELYRAIFSSFYNNSQRNFAILLILRCCMHELFPSMVMGFRSSCPDQIFVYSWIHLLNYIIGSIHKTITYIIKRIDICFVILITAVTMHLQAVGKINSFESLKIIFFKTRFKF